MTPAWRPEPKVASLPQRVLAAWDSYAGTQHLPAAAGACCGACRRPRDLPGAVTVVLGRWGTTGTRRAHSDWDLGALLPQLAARCSTPKEVRRLGHPGHVSRLGEWGPIVHGGAWLTVDATSVEVLFRDLDVFERWVGGGARRPVRGAPVERLPLGAPSYVLSRSSPLPGTSRARCRDHAFRSHWRRRRRNGGRAGRASHSCPPRSRPPRRCRLLAGAVPCTGSSRDSRSARNGRSTRSASYSAPAFGRSKKSLGPSAPPGTAHRLGFDPQPRRGIDGLRAR
jgi:hypothetical protein